MLVPKNVYDMEWLLTILTFRCGNKKRGEFAATARENRWMRFQQAQTRHIFNTLYYTTLMLEFCRKTNPESTAIPVSKIYKTPSMKLPSCTIIFFFFGILSSINSDIISIIKELTSKLNGTVLAIEYNNE